MADSVLSSTKMLSVFKLVMITSAFVVSVRNMPMIAETGLQMLFYTSIPALLFMIPCGMVSAELATGWPQAGGVYVWIRKAFGERWALLSMWFLWVQMFFGMVMILSFAASMWAFVFYPEMATNKVYLIVAIIGMYWLLTFINFGGMKAASFISTWGVILGVLIPGGLIVLLAIVYLIQGNPVQLSFVAKESSFFPDLADGHTWAFLTGIVFGYAGLEMSSVHANEVKNPQRHYPIALLLAILMLLVLNIFGSLSVAIVVPHQNISLVAGIMQAFTAFFHHFHLDWLVPIIAFLAALGGMGQVSTWVLGPCKGILGVAKQGNLPPWFAKTNSVGVPTNLLILQASAISVVGLTYLIIPGVNEAFFLLLIMATQMYIVVYLFMFGAGIKLRYTFPDVHRAYKIPGGNVGIWIVAGAGFLTVLFCFFAGYIPPQQISGRISALYKPFLIVGMLVMGVIPLIIYQFRRPEWKTATDDQS